MRIGTQIVFDGAQPRVPVQTLQRRGGILFPVFRQNKVFDVSHPVVLIDFAVESGPVSPGKRPVDLRKRLLPVCGNEQFAQAHAEGNPRHDRRLFGREGKLVLRRCRRILRHRRIFHFQDREIFEQRVSGKVEELLFRPFLRKIGEFVEAVHGIKKVDRRIHCDEPFNSKRVFLRLQRGQTQRVQPSQRVARDDQALRCEFRVGMNVLYKEPEGLAERRHVVGDIAGKTQSRPFAEGSVHRASDDSHGIAAEVQRFRHCAERRALVVGSDAGDQDDERVGRRRSLPVLIADCRRIFGETDRTGAAERYEVVIPEGQLDPETRVVFLHLEHADAEGVHQRIPRGVVMSGFDEAALHREIFRRGGLAVTVILEDHRTFAQIADDDMAHGDQSHLAHVIRVRAGFRHGVVRIIRVDGAVDACNCLRIGKNELDVQHGVEKRADLIARIRRRGERQNQYAARSDSPACERMSHVFRAPCKSEPCVRRIEDSGDSNCRIGQKTEEFGAASGEFRLKQTADHAPRKGEVVRNHVDAFDSLAGDDGAVDVADGTQNPVHEKVICREHRAVERFNGIVSREFFRDLRRRPDAARGMVIRINDWLCRASCQQHGGKEQHSAERRIFPVREKRKKPCHEFSPEY